jgi:hypothetical protein
VSDAITPKGEALRQAVRWILEQGRRDLSTIEEASRRFDLSPMDEDFLIREFLHRGKEDRREGE